MRRLVVAAFGLALLGVVGLAFWVNAPYAGFSGETFVDIPRGTGSSGMSDRLAEAGVVQNRWLFLAARAFRPQARLKAGEYRFEQPASALEVLDRIAKGDVFLYTLVVPEGHNLFDIADHLAAEKLMDREEFLEAARDPAQIRDLAPKAPTLEGYLFPDTYYFQRKTLPSDLTKMMTDRFRKAWRDLGSPKAPVHEAVTLASLVEKEARVPQERPVVASVYRNRLNIGMALQCDPTTIYAALLENRFRGTIYRSDLNRAHPYNTYQNPGLPPGPIANPGVAALKAALEPAKTDFLYFVAKADGSGGHTFTAGLAEHARAVQQYRRALARAEKQQANGAGSVAERTPARPRGNRAPGRAARAPGAR